MLHFKVTHFSQLMLKARQGALDTFGYKLCMLQIILTRSQVKQVFPFSPINNYGQETKETLNQFKLSVAYWLNYTQAILSHSSYGFQNLQIVQGARENSRHFPQDCPIGLATPNPGQFALSELKLKRVGITNSPNKRGFSQHDSKLDG